MSLELKHLLPEANRYFVLCYATHAAKHSNHTILQTQKQHPFKTTNRIVLRLKF